MHAIAGKVRAITRFSRGDDGTFTPVTATTIEMRVLVVLVAFAGRAIADSDADAPVARTRDATLGDVFRGPFQSSRLFAMPTADVVGAYVLSLSGEGSLLQQPGLLTAAGVLAIGFGDIAQLEYRDSSAISVGGVDAPVPAVGVQVKIPIPERPSVPALGIAFRLGVPRTEQVATGTVTETVTDFYVVVRERPSFAPWLKLHAGARYSPSSIDLHDGHHASKSLVLPTGGIEIATSKQTRVVAELSLVPRFAGTPGSGVDPIVGTGVLGRAGLRWAVVPWLVVDGSMGYEIDPYASMGGVASDVVHQWDIRLGAEVFVPWGALACRAFGAFCERAARSQR